MKTIGKLWIIFSVVGTIVTFLNPYIGLFGLVNFNEFGIMGILIIVAISRQKALEKYADNKLLKTSVKIFGYIIYILSSIFFLIKLFAAVSLFIVAYSNNEIMAPYKIWSNPKQMSIIFLIIEMICNVLLLIAFISRGRSIKSVANR